MFEETELLLKHNNAFLEKEFLCAKIIVLIMPEDLKYFQGLRNNFMRRT